MLLPALLPDRSPAHQFNSSEFNSPRGQTPPEGDRLRRGSRAFNPKNPEKLVDAFPGGNSESTRRISGNRLTPGEFLRGRRPSF